VNVAFGRMITVREVAQTIMHVCGRNDLAIETARPRPGDVHVLRADTGRASEVLGYRASIAFEDGIRRYVDWFRRRHPDPSGLLESAVENWTMPATATTAARSQAVS
jgi:UDP-glucose 4-epimerase